MNLSIHNEKLVFCDLDLFSDAEDAAKRSGKGFCLFRPLLAMLPGVLFRILGELFAVFQILLRQIGSERMFWLWIVDQGYESLDNLISLRCRFPIFRADDGQAHLAFLIYVWMVNFGFEANFWWLERVFGRERDFDPECTFVVGGVFRNNQARP